MWCHLCQWMISRAADTDQSPGPLAARHLSHCEQCRQFHRATHRMTHQLRRDAHAWRHASPHTAHRAAMRSTPAHPRRRDHAPFPRRQVAAAAALASAAVLMIGVFVTRKGIVPPDPVNPPLHIASTPEPTNAWSPLINELETRLDQLLSPPAPDFITNWTHPLSQLFDFHRTELSSMLTRTLTTHDNPLKWEVRNLVQDARAAGEYLFTYLPPDLEFFDLDHATERRSSSPPP